MKVKAWNEQVLIPTYETGSPEKNPVFLEKRVYQGSSGAVYPYPVIETIDDRKIEKAWNVIFLENQFLKIMILPELGGRIQMAFDKTKQRHFVYYNQVIKPALVGLTGPWISGGIEFNWPQHHRPSTYQSVDSYIEENNDGSITVWCSELERMFRTRGMAGFTLYPDKAYLEIKVKLYNRTQFPQTFLWWANPAVKVNDHYQSVFPPDVHAVFDHGKRDVSEFPIAKGTYYKVDYSPGTDISKYKNIPVPTSYMAVASKYDFVGGYENDSKGGLLHIANHHIAPGKKQWTWGHGDFGRAWDRNLTDDDGPYIELMCGVFTDNQPDFSWLMPGEEKTFNQYFMPYRDLGVVKNATKEALVNLEIVNNQAIIKAYTTASYPGGKMVLKYNLNVIAEETFNFHPATSFEFAVQLPVDTKLEQIEVAIYSSTGICLVSWQPDQKEEKEMPTAAKPAKAPDKYNSVEQLFLTGLHLEQYRHATYNSCHYYEEALRRDAGDSRCNNALGLWYLRRGQFVKAENYFRKAIETLTERNPNPIDGEPFFNLGLALKYQNQMEKAYPFFYKSVWNSAWVENGYFQIACIETEKQNWVAALESVDRALIRNSNNHKARQLKVSILRHLHQTADAIDYLNESLKLDKFNFSLYFEKSLLIKDSAALKTMQELIRGNIHNYIEFALDYAQAGLYSEALQLINIGIEEQQHHTIYPMAWYYKAEFENKLGMEMESMESLLMAAKACPDFCFPNQVEAVHVLQWAIKQNLHDAKAPYYLGNYWYNVRNYGEAIANWEYSVSIDGEFPIVLRNLALAYFNKRNEKQKALDVLEKAFRLNPSDARILMELDQLYKRLNYSLNDRLEFLIKNRETVQERDDLFLELITLYNLSGQYFEAFNLLMGHKFHPWEGGEGKVAEQYVLCLTELAKEAIEKKNFQRAVSLLDEAKTYPENLGEGKLPGTPDNVLNYWLGVAFDKMGERKKAEKYWHQATLGIAEPSMAVFYNDQQPDTIFYQGLAYLQLDEQKSAFQQFDKLIEFGIEHLNDVIKIDYFAVSLPDLLIWDDDLNQRNRQLCSYLIALGHLGKGHMDEAKKHFDEVLMHNKVHTGCMVHMGFVLGANR